MRTVLALAALIAAAPAVAQTAVCPFGQTCNGAPAVPFPVINPLQGLNTILTNAQRQNQPPPAPNLMYAPIATPPPVMPPGH